MDDDYGDETELEYIIDAGTREAQELGSWGPLRWLNPPRRIMTDGFVFWDPEDFVFPTEGTK